MQTHLQGGRIRHDRGSGVNSLRIVPVPTDLHGSRAEPRKSLKNSDSFTGMDPVQDINSQRRPISTILVQLRINVPLILRAWEFRLVFRSPVGRGLPLVIGNQT